MRIDLHVHQPECCARVERKVDCILAHLNIIEEKENQIMSTIDDISAGVADETTLIDSIIVMLQNALANAGVPQAKIDAIVAAITANKQKMTDAITANTPVPPQPVTP